MGAPSSHLKFVVHLLTKHSSQSETQNQKNDFDLISQGETLARAGVQSNGWRSVTRNLVVNSHKPHRPRNCYVFSTDPPVHVTRAKPTPAKLRPWNDGRLSPSELFSLDDLEPFQSTDLARLFSKPAAFPVSHRTTGNPHTKRRSAPPHSSSEPAVKRQRFVEGSLHSLIPLPHYHASPYASAHPAHPALGVDKVPFIPMPLPPHTSDTLNTILTSPYIRVAWIIPVRGVPPWPGTSSAIITTSTPHATYSTSSESSTEARNTILWTRESLQAFWAYLLRSTVQSSSPLVFIACSFHAAPRPRAVPHHPESESTTYKSPHLSPKSSFPSAESLPRHRTIDPSTPGALLSTDYIKVYCDASYAFALHKSLIGWTFLTPAPAPAMGIRQEISLEHAAASPLQILENARLVLVDGKSAGLLVM